jgi:guanylate kinase
MPGNLFIVCAPSGAGKTSLVAALLHRDPRVRLSVSFTTRAPRPGEVNGREYHFIDEDRFQAMVEGGEFLESAEVHGNRYGTSQAWIETQRDAGHDILLEIDWQGAQQVRRQIQDVIGIFVMPPSLSMLRARLEGRKQDSHAVIERRLLAARGEISHAGEFDYVIINDDFDSAVEDLVCVVRSSRLRIAAQLSQYADLFNSLN